MVVLGVGLALPHRVGQPDRTFRVAIARARATESCGSRARNRPTTSTGPWLAITVRARLNLSRRAPRASATNRASRAVSFTEMRARSPKAEHAIPG